MMDRVSIVANDGDHAPKYSWRAVFTDTAHDLGLVNMTRPSWEHALGRGYPALMIFHDIGLSDHRVEYITKCYRAEETFRGEMGFAIQVPGDWTAPFQFNPERK